MLEELWTNDSVEEIIIESDNLMFSILENFGINNSNRHEQLYRVESALEGFNIHFYVDNLYAFSMVETPAEFVFSDSGSCKAKMTYKTEVFDCMLGRKLW